MHIDAFRRQQAGSSAQHAGPDTLSMHAHSHNLGRIRGFLHENSGLDSSQQANIAITVEKDQGNSARNRLVVS